MTGHLTVESYRSQGGAQIYRLPLEVFPDFWGYAHLILADGFVALIDPGSGFGDSNSHLEAGLEKVREEHGEGLGWADLTHILITHGHIDHFGGLPYVLGKSQARVGVHELDLKVLTAFEARLGLVSRRLGKFLREAGVPSPKREAILGLYRLNKHLFKSVKVDFTYESVGMEIGPLRLIHTPGHCPGHVVMQLDDILLCGDHILGEISPHQSPEVLSLNSGLEHYLRSLDEIRPLAAQIKFALGGHGAAIEDLDGRIREIETIHMNRLADILAMLEQPMTVAEISEVLFPDVEGYEMLLALEEAGAHIEYLEERGLLGVENLEDLEVEQPTPLVYRRLNAENLEALPLFDRLKAVGDPPGRVGGSTIGEEG